MKTAKTLYVIVAIGLIGLCMWLIRPNKSEPKTLAEEIVANISDTSQRWVRYDEPLSKADSMSSIVGLILISRDEIIENKDCNISLEMPYSEYEVVRMVQPDTFVFNNEETKAILNAYHQVYLIAEAQRLSDSCAKARSAKESSILKHLCKK